MHYKKKTKKKRNTSIINQMQHLHAYIFQPYVLAFDGVDIHSSEHASL